MGIVLFPFMYSAFRLFALQEVDDRVGVFAFGPEDGSFRLLWLTLTYLYINVNFIRWEHTQMNHLRQNFNDFVTLRSQRR